MGLRFDRAIRQRLEGDQLAAGHVAQLAPVLLGPPHVQQQDVLAALKEPMDFFGGELAHLGELGYGGEVDHVVVQGGLVGLEHLLDPLRQGQPQVVHELHVLLSAAAASRGFRRFSSPTVERVLPR